MPNGEQRTILVIGESEHEVLLDLLHAKRLHIDHVRSAHEAVRLLQERSFSVILLESAGPECSPVLDALDLSDGETPIVLVIGGTASALSHRLNANRIHGIIREPFDDEDIADVVEACADIRRRREASSEQAGDIAASLPC